ncbi:MAG TPA: hypothetical protein VFI02_09090 [Armatimonadota bacterium]|nr:hypothetical protein [Armatimonadota bacterium]
MSGDEPKTKISFNPTMVQFWGWSLFKAGALIIALWGGIAFVADYQFERSLKIFHEKAKPEIIKAIESSEVHSEDRLKIHADLPAHSGVIERIHTIETEVNVAATERAQIQSTVDSNARKLDRLLENR